jgi:alkanesulfonate monooxygenase SsuD/methylene tetrahydromethanopterin reductase-like flavin-dependent oxidoreductase (luciferase family)
VRGPLNVARVPQGRPIVAQAGTSEVGRNLAARTADLVFTAQLSLEDAREFYADVKARVAAYGRGPGEVSILPGLTPIVGRTQSEAEDKYHALQDMLPDELAVKALERNRCSSAVTQPA